MQPQILNILDIMKDLVSVQSDTGTKMEENMAIAHIMHNSHEIYDGCFCFHSL